MKAALTIVLVLFLTTVSGQTDDSKSVLDSAKTLFKSTKGLSRNDLDRFDYNQLISLLKKATQLDPENAEAKYFLGYAYSRLNATDGRGIIGMNLNLLYKSSEQFEKVIKLTPKYTGETIALGPYAKLTSEWGSMAMSYWHNNKVDSAIWAFKEGKKRGGFGSFTLQFNRNVLDACSKNALLISQGDNLSIPMWYLQIVENYRTDVSIVDINLLNTRWYPELLRQKKSVSFDLPKEELDTIEHKRWSEKIVTIQDFSWTVKPSYDKRYLLRGDRIFLSLLRENKFKRDVYFTSAFLEESSLNLKGYLSSYIIVDKLSISKKEMISFEAYKKMISKYLLLANHLNTNSPDEVKLFDNLRCDLFYKVDDYLEKGDKAKARELVKLLDAFAGEDKFPYSNENLKNYVDSLRGKI